jgi:sortase A
MRVPDRLGEPSPLCDDNRAVSDILSTSKFLGGQAPSNAPAHTTAGRRRPSGGGRPGGRGRPNGRRPRNGRRSPYRRKSPIAVHALAAALILLGALITIDAGLTLVWQEPFSALYAKLRQDHLSGALKRIERAAPTPSERRTLAGVADANTRIAYLARELQHRAAHGSAVGRIRIPKIGASFVVVKGTRSADLRGGPGIFSETGFPGIPGTTAIAGHRTTYLAPFRHIDALRAGNRILLDMPYAHFTYTVIGHKVVAPTDVGAAVDNVGYSRLVLSACTPLFSAAQRILVFGRLTRTVPVGAALRPPGAVAGRSARNRPIGSLPGDRLAEPRLPAMLETLKLDLAPPRV